MYHRRCGKANLSCPHTLDTNAIWHNGVVVCSYHPIDDVDGLAVIVRGWLHGNTVVLPGRVPAIMDTGYHTGVDRLMDLLANEASMAGLAHIYLTHVHSDHAGGCATLRRRTGATIHAHRDCQKQVEAWDPRALWLEGMGQHMDRFRIERTLVPDDEVETNRLRWRVLLTGGHAVGGVSFYEPNHRILVSGDALWEDGFGVLNVPLEGPKTFNAAQQALDTLAPLDVTLVIPGHGPPFTDFQGAISRAQKTLSSWREDTPRMLRHNLRSGLAFWLLAHEGAPRTDLESVVASFLRTCGEPADNHAVDQVLADLTRAGALQERDDQVFPGDRLKGASKKEN